MAIEVREEQIDGHHVQVTQFPATRGLQVSIAVAKTVGPALGAIANTVMASKGGKGLLDTDISSGAIEQAIQALVEHLDERQTPDLMMRMLEGVRIDGQAVDRTTFDMLFAGSYTLLFKVLVFVVKANRFFDLGAIGMETRPLDRRVCCSGC